MPFIIRIQHPRGTKRLHFASAGSGWSELQKQIEEAYGTPPDAQLISRTPLHDPKFVDAESSHSFSSLGFSHGDMLYLVADEDHEKPQDVSMADSSSSGSGSGSQSSGKQQQVEDKRTNRCQHGPQGMCFHCASRAVDIAPQGKCNHPPHPKLSCSNCNKYVQDPNAPVAEWLCNHDPNSFCPKCIKKDDRDPDNWEVDNKALCQHGPGAVCIHCGKQGPKIKVDLVPYSKFMENLRSMCKHNPSHTCAYCAPPKAESYTGNVNCAGGHKPWPYGICMKCMPPNANLRVQKYRHCDGISFRDRNAVEKFIQLWQQNQGLQRACLLFGRYIDEPTEGMDGAIRAEVEAVYCMRQIGQPGGVRLLRDPNQNKVIEVAKACGLSPVGWSITTLPRGGKQYGGDMLMSGAEIRQAAKYQLQFQDDLGHSRFVTNIIQYNKRGELEPNSYQVSDQCVAMERDQLLQDAEDPGFLASKKAKDGECVPSVIYKNKQLHQGEAFLPDELLVKVISSAPLKARPLFKYLQFPYENATDEHLRGHLKVHRHEEYHVKFSDFNLLVWIHRKIGLHLAAQLAECVRKNQRVSNDMRINLDDRLKNYMN